MDPIEKCLAPRLEGVCKFFDPSRQFGFIRGDDGRDRFFNANHLLPGQSISKGDHVQFIARANRRGLLADRISTMSYK